MAGITYIAKFVDGTYATRFSARHLRPQYPFAWRVKREWASHGNVYKDDHTGYSGRRDLADKTTHSYKDWDNGNGNWGRTLSREVAETRHVMGRLSKRELADLEAVYDAATENA